MGEHIIPPYMQERIHEVQSGERHHALARVAEVLGKLRDKREHEEHWTDYWDDFMGSPTPGIDDTEAIEMISEGGPVFEEKEKE